MVAYAQRPGPPGEFCFRGSGLFSELTVEQRQVIQDKICTLRQAGATREEIRATIDAQLKEYGVEPPKTMAGLCRPGSRGHRHGGFWSQLNEEQRETLEQKIQQMRSSGATREEIRAAVDEQLQVYGIQPLRIGAGRIGECQGLGGPESLNLPPVEELNMESSNYPNPFNPETTITYELQSPDQVTVRIYDIQGQLIRTLAQGNQSSGTHSVLWDGKNESGQTVSSGTYLYQINAGKQTFTRQMILLK